VKCRVEVVHSGDAHPAHHPLYRHAGHAARLLEELQQLELDLVAWREVRMPALTAPHVVLLTVPRQVRLTQPRAGADAGLGRLSGDGHVVDGDDVGTLEGQ
jgi:hypothetical protein